MCLFFCQGFQNTVRGSVTVGVLMGLFPVSRYIDQGRNPQLYTKECLERALAKNEQVKGKIDTMKVRRPGPGDPRCPAW